MQSINTKKQKGGSGAFKKKPRKMVAKRATPKTRFTSGPRYETTVSRPDRVVFRENGIDLLKKVEVSNNTTSVQWYVALSPKRFGNARLSALAKLYEFYRFERVKVTFQPTSSATTCGLMRMWYDPDPIDGTMTTASAITHPNVCSNVWNATSLTLDKELNHEFKWFATSEDSAHYASDYRLGQQGQFAFIADGLESQDDNYSLGDIIFEYSISFSGPYLTAEEAPTESEVPIIVTAGSKVVQSMPAAVKDTAKKLIEVTVDSVTKTVTSNVLRHAPGEALNTIIQAGKAIMTDSVDASVPVWGTVGLGLLCYDPRDWDGYASWCMPTSGSWVSLGAAMSFKVDGRAYHATCGNVPMALISNAGYGAVFSAFNVVWGDRAMYVHSKDAYWDYVPIIIFMDTTGTCTFTTLQFMTQAVLAIPAITEFDTAGTKIAALPPPPVIAHPSSSSGPGPGPLRMPGIKLPGGAVSR